MNTKQIIEYINLLKPNHMQINAHYIYDEDWDYAIRLHWNRSHGVNNILGFRTRINKPCINRFKWLNDIFNLIDTREVNLYLVELTYTVKDD